MSVLEDLQATIRARDEQLLNEEKKYREITTQLVIEQNNVLRANEQLQVEQGKVKQLQRELKELEYLLLKEKTRTGRTAIREWWETGRDDWKTMWQRVIGHDAEVPEETAKELEIILRGIPREGAVLEIGAGVGRLLKGLTPYFASVKGVDPSETYVQMSSTYLAESDCVILLNDGLHLPFSDESFSFVFAYTCFQHMPTIGVIRANLREAYRVLYADGYFRFQTVHGEPNPEKHDGWVFASRESLMEEVLNAGFADVQIEEGLTAPNHFWVTARKKNA